MSVELRWRQVGLADLPAITALHTAAVATDGGSPFAAAEWLLRRWYLDHVDASLAAFRGDELIGISARRAPSRPAGAPWKIAGLVAPGHRGQGLGARLLDFALDGAAADAAVLVETESLTQAADVLYRSRGLRQSFAEDVMTHAACPAPSGYARRTRCPVHRMDRARRAEVFRRVAGSVSGAPRISRLAGRHMDRADNR